MDLHFLGGIFENSEQAPAGDWVCDGPRARVFLRRRSDCGALFTWGSLAILLRG